LLISVVKSYRFIEKWVVSYYSAPYIDEEFGRVSGLNGKKILLGVTGGIAAYKSADLVRRLIERGAVVQVVMTDAAQKFITPLTMQALSGSEVRTSLLDTAAEAAMGHIELARWADTILVAPASADFLARLRVGMANDLLTTLCLASDRPLMLAPAMNQQMYAAASTQDNIQVLKQRGAILIGPAAGEQACGDVGLGRMVEPTEIADEVAKHFLVGPLSGVKLLLTAGPTREQIDPVRYISNNSSGKMGYCVAQAAAELGADVTLVSGPTALPTPSSVDSISVSSAAEMYRAVMQNIERNDIFIATAAVADYRPLEQGNSKIKKSDGAPQIALEQTADILATVGADFPSVFTLGFAAETDDLISYARSKLEKKRLNMVAANWVGEGVAFDQPSNALTVVTEDEEIELPELPKEELARALMALVVERYIEQQENK
jgi:phosphopantothenoylcysteine decarboxylase/phosphopantothenate--cysteine ligase